MKYRKKPLTIEALQLKWDTWEKMCEFAQIGEFAEGKPTGGWVDSIGEFYFELPLWDHDQEIPGLMGLSYIDGLNWKLGMAIPTLEGIMIAKEGDYIIKGVDGKFYPCEPDVFETIYETATEELETKE